MSQFVNYKKRSISLPSGCADLIDVLRGRSETPQEPLARISSLSYCVDAKVSDLAIYIGMVHVSDARRMTLQIGMVDKGDVVSILHAKDCATWSAFLLECSPEQDPAVREFISRRGLPVLESGPIQDSVLPADQFRTLYFISPHTSNLAITVDVLTSLFCKAAGLNADSQLRFTYDEIPDR